MTTEGSLPTGDLAPEDWPSAAEREFARLQADYAAEYDVEMASRVVDTASTGRVQYLEAGDPDGEPVLLLHGLSAIAAYWAPMLPDLEDYRLLVPDRPGRGLSAPASYPSKRLRSFMTGYLVDLLDALDIDRPHVVGNSLGGLQAFLLALDHDRVDRICLVGAPGGVSRDIPFAYRLLTVPGLNRFLTWLASRGDPLETVRENYDDLVVDRSAIPPVYYEVQAAGNQLPGRQESLRSFATAAGSFARMHPMYDLTDELPALERPTAFVWGSEDWFFEPEVGRPVAESMPDAAFHELEDYGHIPWFEPDQRVGGLVREFLDG